MKTEFTCLAVITLAAALLAACGTDTAEVSLPPASPASETSAAPAPAETGNPDDADAAVLGECTELLGLDDEQSAGYLGGGEQNTAADGKTLIGRVYSAELFGERVQPSTSYGPDGKVDVVSIYLSRPDGGQYASRLTELYGAPENSESAVSESGSTWQSWKANGAELKLYQSYGLCTIEITAQ